MKKTRVCDILGIEYPIIQGGMNWVSNWDLAWAVSEAGALGLIGSASMSPEELRENIRKVRERTDKPFGVNIPILRPQAQDIVQTCLDEGVKIFATSAGNPERVVPSLKEQGVTCMHVVPTVRGAKKAAGAGCDIVVCEGYEAGGHNGMDEITTLTLVPQVVDAVEAPVVAAGGIADGRGIAAAMALGAEGVQMGTRFIATAECNAHQSFKQSVVDCIDSSTCISGRHLNMMRVIRNDFALRMIEAEKKGIPTEELIKLIGDEYNRAEAGMVKGDLKEGVLEVGQSAGLVKEIITVKELIECLVHEYDEAVKSLV